MTIFWPLTLRGAEIAFAEPGDKIDRVFLPTAAHERIAAQPLGGHRAVIAVGADGADYADASNPEHVGRVIGITTGAAAQGAPIAVQSAGAIDEPSWAWTPDVDVWLGSNGQITQTTPAAAFAQRLGFALTPTRLWLELQVPVVL